MLKEIVQNCFPSTHPLAFDQLDGILVVKVANSDLVYDQELLLESIRGSWVVEASDRAATIDTGKTVIHLIACGSRR